jgi:hypothetical protein
MKTIKSVCSAPAIPINQNSRMNTITPEIQACCYWYENIVDIVIPNIF